MRRYFRAVFVGLACAGATAAFAQTTSVPTTSAEAASGETAPTKPAHRKFDPYQSPLATIMQFRLRAGVPEAQDFVRQSRPNAKDLQYTPLQSQVGPDPVRPKPRDSANVSALQAELEASIAHNAARVGSHGKAKAHRAKADAAAN